MPKKTKEEEPAPKIDACERCGHLKAEHSLKEPYGCRECVCICYAREYQGPSLATYRREWARNQAAPKLDSL